MLSTGCWWNGWASCRAWLAKLCPIFPTIQPPSSCLWPLVTPTIITQVSSPDMESSTQNILINKITREAFCMSHLWAALHGSYLTPVLPDVTLVSVLKQHYLLYPLHSPQHSWCVSHCFSPKKSSRRVSPPLNFSRKNQIRGTLIFFASPLMSRRQQRHKNWQRKRVLL